jgi:hypothetical protein
MRQYSQIVDYKRNKVNSQERFRSRFSRKSGAKHLKLNESELKSRVGQEIRNYLIYKKQIEFVNKIVANILHCSNFGCCIRKMVSENIGVASKAPVKAGKEQGVRHRLSSAEVKSPTW